MPAKPLPANHPILVIREIRRLADIIGQEVRLVPRDQLTDCERDCLTIVEEAGGVPITTTGILAELDCREWLWGESTVKAALASLVKSGLLHASRRSPRGYSPGIHRREGLPG